jgi:hypothetical protein
VNHESNLQGIPLRETVSRQTRFPQRAVSRFQIKDLGILHGRLRKLGANRHYVLLFQGGATTDSTIHSHEIDVFVLRYRASMTDT